MVGPANIAEYYNVLGSVLELDVDTKKEAISKTFEYLYLPTLYFCRRNLWRAQDICYAELHLHNLTNIEHLLFVQIYNL